MTPYPRLLACVQPKCGFIVELDASKQFSVRHRLEIGFFSESTKWRRVAMLQDSSRLDRLIADGQPWVWTTKTCEPWRLPSKPILILPHLYQERAVCEIRFAAPGSTRGKSGSLRIGFAHFRDPGIILLLEVWSKKDKANLTQAERNAIAGELDRFEDLIKTGKIQ